MSASFPLGGNLDQRMKAAASEITDLWWARPDENGAAKTAVVEEILRRHIPDEAVVKAAASINGKKGSGKTGGARKGAGRPKKVKA